MYVQNKSTKNTEARLVRFGGGGTEGLIKEGPGVVVRRQDPLKSPVH